MTAALLAAAPLYAQEDDIMDIRGLAGDTYWEANWPWLVPTVIVGAVVVIFLIRLIVKRLNRPRPLTARELALKQLSEARAILEDGQPDADKRFSFAVSDALRGYMERALGLRAPEQTTEEFLATARHNPQLKPSAVAVLGEFLGLCDLAKFARHAFGSDERERLLSTATSFIEKIDLSEEVGNTAGLAQEERDEVEGDMRKLIAPAPKATPSSAVIPEDVSPTPPKS
ncbi:MAG: hypothetical protein Q7Q73_08730 [Verrucomicrobiota bacterium JB024]|nr:hypothetical protein [Verrucomicrobiota bacterium JB024]